MPLDSILADARRLPDKEPLLRHKKAVLLLRAKSYTWREIAEFLRERGVVADHTTLYRLFKGERSMNTTTSVPSAKEYADALQKLKLNDTQLKMLGAHYAKQNRSITYTELADAAGSANYGAANLQYGQLGRDLGEAVGFEFIDAEDRPGEKFYSSALGMPNPYSEGEFQLVMHHELAKAIEQLKWFEEV
jgi:hypothetical protein